MKINIFKIKANAPQRKTHQGFDAYVRSMEALMSKTITESVAAFHEASIFIPYKMSFEKLLPGKKKEHSQPLSTTKRPIPSGHLFQKRLNGNIFYRL